MNNTIKQHQQEQIKLQKLLQVFLTKKEAKEEDLKIVESIILNRIRLHKEGKQQCAEVVEIVDEYIFNLKIGK